jgi:hypothetical protein
LIAVTAAVAIVAGVSLWRLIAALPALPPTWKVQVLVFVAVATVPHWLVEGFASLAVTLGRDLKPGDHKIGFRNPGAYLGLLERVLFFGSLVAGYPEFVAMWFLFKGIAGYRVGLPETRARRTFQLFLLNNAVSLAGVALGWLVWNLLGLPVVKTK